MDIKDLEQQIDTQVQRYQSVVAKSDSLDSLLNAKDWFVAQLSFIGQKEADLMEAKIIDENAYEVKKNQTYKDERATKSIEDSKTEARLQSAGLELDAGMSLVAYKRAYHLRERTHKVIDAISQRVAVLRKEKDALQ